MKNNFSDKYKVSASGCWEWQGHLTCGYGSIKIDQKTIRAHRYSYQIHKGKIPDGMLVCHKCDNRRCVNPDHLFLGDYKDNYDDSRSKGRAYTGGTTNPAYGERNGSAKITHSIAQEIREFLKLNNVSAASRKFGLSRPCIRDIRDGRAWQPLPQPPTAAGDLENAS